MPVYNIQATAAQLNTPSAVAIDASGNIYLTDAGNHRIRKVTVSTGVITTIAGTGATGFGGDGGPATLAVLNNPAGLIFDGSGNLLFTDGNRVRKIITVTGFITTVAGTATAGYNGDNLIALTAQLNKPTDIAVDASNNVYIADNLNYRVRKLTVATGIITTIAGNGGTSYSGDNAAATAAQVQPLGLAINAAGDLYITHTSQHCIRKVTISTGIITLFAGMQGIENPVMDGDPANGTSLTSPDAMVTDPSGNVYFTQSKRQHIRRVSNTSTPMVMPVYSVATGNGGPAVNAFFTMRDITTDAAGNIFIADGNLHQVKKITAATGIITVVAGTGDVGFSGDGGPAVNAIFLDPAAVAVDAAGNIYIADRLNHRIRRIDATTNIITTVAGNGTPGFPVSGSIATSTSINLPAGLVLDAAGNLYISGSGNNAVFKVAAGTNIITSVAGTGTAGYNGDGITATSARLNLPSGLRLDNSGNLLICDYFNHRIRKVNLSTGIITTIAGTGVLGFSGDGGPATSAQINVPHAIEVDVAGRIFIAEEGNHRVRYINPLDGNIYTLAGNGTFGFSGDGGPAALAALKSPDGLSISPTGELYVADQKNYRIRVLSSPVVVRAKIFLQGALSGGSMTTALNTLNLLPLTQPYNRAPWNYTGTENVPAIPVGVTDWVLVELRDATTPSTTIATRAAFIKNDGSVVDLDGVSAVLFDNVTPGNFHIAIKHRNHLPIRTATAQALNANSSLYDFTTAQSKAYQNVSITTNTAMRDIGGVFAMWVGNGNANTVCNYGSFGSDRVFLLTQTNSVGLFTRGLGNEQTVLITNVYGNNDFNMNGSINYGSFGSDRAFLINSVLSNDQTIVRNQHL